MEKKRPTYSTNFVVSYSELPLVISRSSGHSLGLRKSRVSKTGSCLRITNDLTQSDFLKTKATISGNLFSCGSVSRDGGGLNRLRINQTQTFHEQTAFPLGISKMLYKALFLISLIVCVINVLIFILKIKWKAINLSDSKQKYIYTYS